MDHLYEIVEVGLTNASPTYVQAPHPKAAIEREVGPVHYAGGTLLDGNGPIRFYSSLLDSDRNIYFEVRDVEASLVRRPSTDADVKDLMDVFEEATDFTDEDWQRWCQS